MRPLVVYASFILTYSSEHVSLLWVLFCVHKTETYRNPKWMVLTQNYDEKFQTSVTNWRPRYHLLSLYWSRGKCCVAHVYVGASLTGWLYLFTSTEQVYILLLFDVIMRFIQLPVILQRHHFLKISLLFNSVVLRFWWSPESSCLMCAACLANRYNFCYISEQKHPNTQATTYCWQTIRLLSVGNPRRLFKDMSSYSSAVLQSPIGPAHRLLKPGIWM